mgnify:CR=1 FL=1
MQVTAYSPTDAFMCRRRTATLSTKRTPKGRTSLQAMRPCSVRARKLVTTTTTTGGLQVAHLGFVY